LGYAPQQENWRRISMSSDGGIEPLLNLNEN